MKQRILILLVTILVLSLVLSLAACNLFGNGGSESTAPVYKGMTVSDSLNGGTDTFIYAETYQTVFITINFDNADNLAIVSVTINGKTVDASSFESGSSREKVVVKFNVMDTTGIVPYTLESFKYVDGKVQKDGTLSGDTTVYVGVFVDNQVSAFVTEEKVGFTEIALKVTITDGNGLIAFSNGYVQVELYCEGQLVEARGLSVGDNTVTFANLDMGKWYLYQVVGFYDSLQDGGKSDYTLYGNTLRTNKVVDFGTVNVTYDSATFSFNWHEDATGYSIKQLELIDGDTDRQLDASATSVTGLLSDKDYAIVAYYEHNGATYQIRHDFHTPVKHAPSLALSNLWVEENLIRIDVRIVDEDHAGTLVVTLDGQNVTVNNHNQISFSNLNYGQTYQIVVAYNYDLNDGDGMHDLSESLTVTTDSQTIHQTSCKLAYKVLDDSNSTCAVTKNTKCTHSEVRIPESIDGYTVAEIRNFANSANLTSITLPDTVTAFGSGAFSGCAKLTNVNIPSKVTAISDNLFSGCTQLANFTIPSGITTIGVGAFTNCQAMTTVTIPASITSIGAQAFRGTSLQTLTFEADSKLATIGKEAFYELSNLTALAIPSSVETIDDYAFADCTALQNLTFESDGQLRTIGKSAFYRCEQLTQLHLPSELYSIGDRAFVGTNIATLTIPKSVVYIKAYAFASNSLYGGLQELIFENDSSLIEIGDEAFYWTRISSVAIPRSVMTIGANAFRKCTDLSQVEFGANSNLQTIGGGAFAECTSLRRITIPANVRTIGDSAFENCSATVSFDSGSKLSTIGNRAFYGGRGISSITIPASVTSIGSYAFNSCVYLRTITFEADCNLRTIGSYAFGDCNYLTAVTIPASVVTIGERAFYGSAVRTVTCEDDSNLKTIGSYAFAECALSTITIPSSVTTVGEGAFQGCSGANTVTFKEGSQLTTIGAHAFEGCVAITEVEIPCSVATIGESAFKGCSLLNTFTFEEGSRLQSIGAYFFEGCNLITEIVIPASVTSIGAYAFQNLANLQAVQFETGSQLQSIGSGAFKGCSSLPYVTLPDGLVELGAGVFSECDALQWVVMPKSIKTIGNMAIERNSATIYYKGNYTEWCRVTMSSGDRNYFQEMYYNVYFYDYMQGYPTWYYKDGVPTPNTARA